VSKLTRPLALGYLATLIVGASALPVVRGVDYSEQNREFIAAPVSMAHPLGTDELGRDRLARMLEGIRVSLLLAPAASLIAVAVAAVAGVWAGWRGGWWDRALDGVSNVMLCLPGFFVLITARAALPLDSSPWTSVTVTFVLLGLLGWAGPSRVIRASTRALSASAFVTAAQARGTRPWRIACFQLLPNLRPILAAQFWMGVPLFLLAESNLSFLGLGVSEPLPSWGTMLKELERPGALPAQPAIVVPAIALALCVASLHAVIPAAAAATGGAEARL
jgi:ABC-type dipeptide/oligopeptide/nickel transport system permease subunit